MAKTTGWGNPKWTREETILALELYHKSANTVPGPNDPRVVQLSELLRRNPVHAQDARKPSFRNPDGVGLKLQNIKQAATGHGLGIKSKMDQAIWDELGNRPADVRKLAGFIRSAIAELDEVPDASGEEEFQEGRSYTQLHKRR